MSTELWDASALEKDDGQTVRINAQIPQLAVSEYLFHYPLYMLDPGEGGAFVTTAVMKLSENLLFGKESNELIRTVQ